jgi:hypothetical protein
MSHARVFPLSVTEAPPCGETSAFPEGAVPSGGIVCGAPREALRRFLLPWLFRPRLFRAFFLGFGPGTGKAVTSSNCELAAQSDDGAF